MGHLFRSGYTPTGPYLHSNRNRLMSRYLQCRNTSQGKITWLTIRGTHPPILHMPLGRKVSTHLQRYSTSLHPRSPRAPASFHVHPRRYPRSPIFTLLYFRPPIFSFKPPCLLARSLHNGHLGSRNWVSPKEGEDEDEDEATPPSSHLLPPIPHLQIGISSASNSNSHPRFSTSPSRRTQGLGVSQ